ncbi:MAG: hypothetical protein ABWY93_08000 [Mycobacterium sp.]
MYVVGSAITALGVYVERRFIRNDGSPTPDNLPVLTMLTGLVWPVVLLGAVQFGILIVVRRLTRLFSPVAPQHVFETAVLQMSGIGESGVTPVMGARGNRSLQAA